MKKRIESIAVLGSTGSVGRQTLEVSQELGLRVEALAAAGGNIGLLLEQIKEFHPKLVAVSDAAAAGVLSRAPGVGVEVLSGPDGLSEAAARGNADAVVVAVSGMEGLPAVMSAIKAGKTVALANKETLVAGGRLVMEAAKAGGVDILPVDSEHSAIFQCLQGHDQNDVKRLILTASGGPFRGCGRAELENVTPERALAHPVWNMGRQISIDSATLMNKGLEVIEAARLFGMAAERIDALIHPQSVIHSMVEFKDNAILAQLGTPDMRMPIQYALTYPERRAGLSAALDFTDIGRLTFEKPDLDAFPCLSLAYAALRAAGTMPAVCGAANETAVGLFLDGAIRFMDIPALIEYAMERHAPTDDMVIENIYEACREARERVSARAGERRRT